MTTEKSRGCGICGVLKESGQGAFKPVYTLTTPLSPGVYTWTVQAHDLGGNTTLAGPGRFGIAAPARRVYLPEVRN